jgi:hypothetical protein
MTWDFLLSTGEHNFLTSDNPLVISDHTDKSGSPIGFLLKKTELGFPITRNMALFAYWSNNQFTQYKYASNVEVKEINRNTVINARRFIFAPKKLRGIQNLVKKYRNYAPKVEVVHYPPYIRIVNKPY